VISERTPDRKRLVFTALDPLQGPERELAGFDTDPRAEYASDLSSDGTHVAIIERLGGAKVKILSLLDGGKREISVNGWTALDSVKWTADGKGLFVTSHATRSSTLFAVDLNGKARRLWSERGDYGLDVVPSPDG
jgi:Tol biopolymer transport system component